MEVPQKGTQRPAHYLPGLRAPILGVALDVADHILLTDLAEVIGAGEAYLVQKSADRWEVTDDRLRCETALTSQVVGKLGEYLVVRSERWRCRRSDRTCIAQHS